MEHQETLTQAEIDLRLQFISEYLIDWDYFRACIRIGYNEKDAHEVAKKFKVDKFVQVLISKAQVAIGDEGEEAYESDCKKRIITGLFKAANDYGPDSNNSSRVAAWARLSAIYGMDKPQQIEAKLEVEKVPDFDFTNCDKTELALYRQLVDHQIAKHKESKIE